MEEFIVKVYTYPYFPYILGGIIGVLILAFIIVFFAGRKKPKKEADSVDAMAQTNEPVALAEAPIGDSVGTMPEANALENQVAAPVINEGQSFKASSEAPVINDTVQESPVVETEPIVNPEPVIETPAVEVSTEPVVEPVAEPVVETPVVEPIPAAPIEINPEPVIETPVVEVPAEPVVEPVQEVPVMQVADLEPIPEQQEVVEPVQEISSEPVVESPAVETPVVEPAVENPVEVPAVEPVVEPVVETPVVAPVQEVPAEPVIEPAPASDEIDLSKFNDLASSIENELNELEKAKGSTSAPKVDEEAYTSVSNEENATMKIELPKLK